MAYHGGMASPPPSDGLVPVSSPTLPSSPPPRISRMEKKKAILTPRKFRRFFTPRGMPSQGSRERPALADLSSPAVNAQPTPPRTSPQATEPMSPASDKSLLSPFDSEDGLKKRKRSVVNAIPMKLPPSTRGSNTKRSRTRLEDLEDTPLGRSPLARSPLGQNYRSAPEDQMLGSPEVQSPSDHRLAALGRIYPSGPQVSPDEFARKLSSLTASNFATMGYEGLRPRSTLVSNCPSPCREELCRLTFSRLTTSSATAQGFRRSIKEGPPHHPQNRTNSPHRSPYVLLSTPTKMSWLTSVQPIPEYRPQPVIKLRNRGFGAQLLLREQGSTPRPGREHLEYPAFGKYFLPRFVGTLTSNC